MNNQDKIIELENEILQLTGKKFAKARKAIREKMLKLKESEIKNEIKSNEMSKIDNLQNELLLLTGKKNAKKRKEVMNKISYLNLLNKQTDNIEEKENIGEKEDKYKSIWDLIYYKEDHKYPYKNPYNINYRRNKVNYKSNNLTNIILYPSWLLNR
tara:strand:- start:3149 stop:3616 length:468 start_codon:yes stop_codon:yes gene_type:complete